MGKKEQIDLCRSLHSVTTTWRVLGLWMEERPPDMEGKKKKKKKNSFTSTRIEPAAFRLVAQCLKITTVPRAPADFMWGEEDPAKKGETSAHVLTG
jgi:hypothetical protein